MNIIVDTCVWSEAFRKVGKSKAEAIVLELRELIREGRAVLLGVIRQETLSGIRHPKQFETLRERLRAFEDFAIDVTDYETAAEIFNRLRSKGIQGSNTDFLICAASMNHQLSIFTTDKDFELYAKHLHLNIHKIRSHEE